MVIMQSCQDCEAGSIPVETAIRCAQQTKNATKLEFEGLGSNPSAPTSEKLAKYIK